VYLRVESDLRFICPRSSWTTKGGRTETPLASGLCRKLMLNVTTGGQDVQGRQTINRKQRRQGIGRKVPHMKETTKLTTTKRPGNKREEYCKRDKQHRRARMSEKSEGKSSKETHSAREINYLTHPGGPKIYQKSNQKTHRIQYSERPKKKDFTWVGEVPKRGFRRLKKSPSGWQS